MKYDVLGPYKQYLYEKFSKNTAKTYYTAVNKLLDNQQFNSAEEIDVVQIESIIGTLFSTKNEFSAAKNGLKHLKNYYHNMKIPSETFFKESSQKKRNRSKKPKKNINIDSIKRTINQMENEKLKYAYRLALVSGLRVSELADLEANDLKFTEGIISVTVRNGKGGKGGIIECMQDNYLYEKLQEYTEKKLNGKIFYSEVYMRENADNLGFECHDLRRAFSIIYRNSIKEEMPIEEANKLTQEKLRHVRFSTTKRYLFNRKLTIKPRREKNKKNE